MIEKTRLDKYLLDNGFCETREKARALIMSGIVFVDNDKADKAGFIVKEGQPVEVRGNTLKYVSRGGLKLEKAIEKYDINLKDFTCMDIGASTGGFTDCMLQNLASKVYSIDVGYGQLAWSLRNDPRVVNMERTNFRYVTNETISEQIAFASIDVSFISLKLILPVLYPLLSDTASVVCLVKPQFEAGRGKVGKKGVVKEFSVHLEVLKSIYDFCINNNYSVIDVDFSPIKGPEGNIEFLFFISKEKQISFEEQDLEKIVKASHKELMGGEQIENLSSN
jgi:23S rRNA (cytidine1920-2'-O)/16S rRNA (cytidine1409-2'-O)-methyltransferase